MGKVGTRAQVWRGTTEKKRRSSKKRRGSKERRSPSRKRRSRTNKRGNRRRGSKKRSKSSRKRSKRANNKRRNNNRTKRRRGVNHRGGALGLAMKGRNMLNRFGKGGSDTWVGDKQWNEYNSHAANIIEDIESLLQIGVAEDSSEVQVLMKDFDDLADGIRHYSEAITDPLSLDPYVARSYIQTLGNVAINAEQGTLEAPVKRFWMHHTESRPIGPNRLVAAAELAQQDEEAVLLENWVAEQAEMDLWIAANTKKWIAGLSK